MKTIFSLSLLMVAHVIHADMGLVLRESGVEGGVVVCIGAIDVYQPEGTGKEMVELMEKGSFLIQCLDADADRINKARKYIRSKGLYGKISVDFWDGKSLPFVDNCINAIIQTVECPLSKGEIERVLAPRGAIIVPERFKSQVSSLSPQVVENWVVGHKPVPATIDDWPHFLHGADNNAVANDKVVASPTGIQWQVAPLYCRSHEIDSSVSALVSAGGRIFYILDEGLIGITDDRFPAKWAIVARDAFNGISLWRKPITEWGWQTWNPGLKGKDWTTLRGLRGKSPQAVARRLVASKERVFVTLGYGDPLSILDAATGKVIHTCRNTEGTDEIIFHANTLIVCIRRAGDRNKEYRGRQLPPDRIAAIDPETGSVKWEKPIGGVRLFSLSAIDDNVVLKAGGDLVCLKLKDGQEKWKIKFNKPGTLVLHKHMVLNKSGRSLDGFSILDGTKIYSVELQAEGRRNYDDLLVAQGLIWHSSPQYGLIPKGRKYWDRGRQPQTDLQVTAYDPLTGELKKTFLAKNAITPGHHARCYRSKATDNFILWPKRGIEFVDLGGDNHMRNDWVRGACKYGVMPANGLVYSPPNQCFCYTGVNLRGFNALTGANRRVSRRHAETQRLEKGPAYSEISNPASGTLHLTSSDWSSFRNGFKRSGSTSSEVKDRIKEDWRLDLGGPLSQPVAAGENLYVARVDAHELTCIDRKTGKKKWAFTAGGRIDSPPTIYNRCAIFGSRDGYVYCLLADSGQLAWKFRAAPMDQRSGFFEQLESVWPVNGAVPVVNDTVYAAAGRHSFLDGGIRVYGLNPQTGHVKYRTTVEGPYPDMEKEIGEPFDMRGCFSDVLVSDGKHIYIQQVMMDLQLNQVEPEKITRMGDRKFGMHVFSTAGFLDDSWWNRTFWMNTERFPGFYIANQSPKAGQLLVHDNRATYAVKCYTTRNIHSPMFFPGKTGYLLFADDNRTEPTLKGQPGSKPPIPWLSKLTVGSSGDKGRSFRGNAINVDKGIGLTRSAPPLWQEWHPIRIRAMVLATDTLFVAGPPDVLVENDPLAAFEGRRGGIMRAVSAKDGKTLSELELDCPPVFDGLIAAHGALFMSMYDGSVRCYK